MREGTQSIALNKRVTPSGVPLFGPSLDHQRLAQRSPRPLARASSRAKCVLCEQDHMHFEHTIVRARSQRCSQIECRKWAKKWKRERKWKPRERVQCSSRPGLATFSGCMGPRKAQIRKLPCSAGRFEGIGLAAQNMCFATACNLP